MTAYRLRARENACDKAMIDFDSTFDWSRKWWDVFEQSRSVVKRHLRLLSDIKNAVLGTE